VFTGSLKILVIEITGFSSPMGLLQLSIIETLWTNASSTVELLEKATSAAEEAVQATAKIESALGSHDIINFTSNHAATYAANMRAQLKQAYEEWAKLGRIYEMVCTEAAAAAVAPSAVAGAVVAADDVVPPAGAVASADGTVVAAHDVVPPAGAVADALTANPAAVALTSTPMRQVFLTPDQRIKIGNLRAEMNDAFAALANCANKSCCQRVRGIQCTLRIALANCAEGQLAPDCVIEFAQETCGMCGYFDSHLRNMWAKFCAITPVLVQDATAAGASADATVAPLAGAVADALTGNPAAVALTSTPMRQVFLSHQQKIEIGRIRAEMNDAFVELQNCGNKRCCQMVLGIQGNLRSALANCADGLLAPEYAHTPQETCGVCAYSDSHLRDKWAEFRAITAVLVQDATGTDTSAPVASAAVASVPMMPASGAPMMPASGASAAVAGVPAAVAGVPAAVAGVPAAVAGVPAAVAGVPAAVAGASAAVDGVPAAVTGVPAAVAGVPAAVAGVPAAVADVPAAVAGVPAAVADIHDICDKIGFTSDLLAGVFARRATKRFCCTQVAKVIDTLNGFCTKVVTQSKENCVIPKLTFSTVVESCPICQPGLMFVNNATGIILKTVLFAQLAAAQADTFKGNQIGDLDELD
jgi:hypothetical protein